MDFKNVPKEYRPIPFWSWNEKMDTAETAEQTDKMCAQGIGGFFMHARGGLQTEYMGEEWFENIAVCAEKAEKNGMHPWAYDENGWPSGFGGGIINGKGIKYQQKYLRYSEGECDGEHTIANKDGYHFYYDVNPFYVDNLDGEVVKSFIDEIYQPYYDKFKGRLDGFFTDEPQLSRLGIPWSFVLPDEYRKAYGDELTDRLIELFKPVGDYKTTRVRFWRLVTNLFSKNFMKQIYDWCAEHGFKFTGHLLLEESLLSQLTTNGACMPHYEYLSIPGMDWLGKHNRYSLTPYQVGSAARQLGKKQVLSETFAMCGHNVGHDELKWMFEYQMVRGINLLCQHLEGYSNRGLRKRDYPPAMYIQQPWWDEYKTFNDSMSRIGMLLSGGDDGVDVLVIHPQTTAWAMYDVSAESEEKIKKYNDDFCEILQMLEKKHINFHLGDETLMERHGRVDGKYFVIGEKKYSKIIIPPHEVFFDNTERLLDEFSKNGGSIVVPNELESNSIIDVPQITYCERHYDDFDMYYFVNSTEDTYTAHISCGNKVLDITNGELADFGGVHMFRKYESLVVIDDHSGLTAVYAPEKKQKEIDLGGMWKIKNLGDNAITLDYCDYYFDGVLEEKNGYILNAMYRAIDRMRPTHITCEYKVEAKYLPSRLFLVCETPEIMEIYINGKKIDKTDCGYFADKSFRKIDIAGKLETGENTIRIETDFKQSEQVYKNIENSKKFESEKNKLTFDMEIEQIYLVGDFSVECDGDIEELDKNAYRFNGKFVIAEPKKEICLDKISRQGFPFFAGSMTVEKEFNADSADMMLDFEKCGINVIKVKINGADVGKFMWEPYRADVSEFVHEGKNTIELTLINNLRNLEGPFHLAEGETDFTVPSCFYKEECIWSRGREWNDGYCFADVSLTNRK